MNGQTNSAIVPVDLVIVCDTSASMREQAVALSQAAESAIEAARSSCPSDLRVVWLGIEDTWRNTNFDRTVRSYLIEECGVAESAIRGRKKGAVEGFGAQEDGARTIEDIANHFDWRPEAVRSMFYLSDEALEGGGSEVNEEDINAANRAIKTAKAASMTVHTYFGTTHSQAKAELHAEFARVANETGGQAFTEQDAISGFAEVLEKVICAVKEAGPPEPEPTTPHGANTVACVALPIVYVNIGTEGAAAVDQSPDAQTLASLAERLSALTNEADAQLKIHSWTLMPALFAQTGPQASSTSSTSGDMASQESSTSDKQTTEGATVTLIPGQVQDFYNASLAAALQRDEDDDTHGWRGFIKAIGTCASVADAPDNVKKAHAFYHKRVEEADWGSVRLYTVSVYGVPTYAVQVISDGDPGWLEIYGETGDEVGSGELQNHAYIQFSNKETVRSHFRHLSSSRPLPSITFPNTLRRR